jgi:hypothetical protein
VRAKAGTKRFPEGYFSMQGDAELYELAGNTPAPVAVRIQWAAMARGNVWGHAGFKPGELASLIALGNNSRRTLNKGISDLIAWGVAAPTSTSRCILLSAALYRRADRNRKFCEEPKHEGYADRMWVARIGLEPQPGFYQAELDAGNGQSLIQMRQRRVVEETETVTMTTTTTTTRTRRQVDESAVLAV